MKKKKLYKKRRNIFERQHKNHVTALTGRDRISTVFDKLGMSARGSEMSIDIRREDVYLRSLSE